MRPRDPNTSEGPLARVQAPEIRYQTPFLPRLNKLKPKQRENRHRLKTLVVKALRSKH